jgi:hypothetical protein
MKSQNLKSDHKNVNILAHYIDCLKAPIQKSIQTIVIDLYGQSVYAP